MEHEQQMVNDLKLILSEIEDVKKLYFHIIKIKEELLYTCIQLSEIKDDLKEINNKIK
jgi:hypothetical protein